MECTGFHVTSYWFHHIDIVVPASNKITYCSQNHFLERVFCYLQGNNSINVLKQEFKTFLCLEGFPYFKVLLEAGTTVL